jgi:hypothetical protein
MGVSAYRHIGVPEKSCTPSPGFVPVVAPVLEEVGSRLSALYFSQSLSQTGSGRFYKLTREVYAA